MPNKPENGHSRAESSTSRSRVSSYRRSRTPRRKKSSSPSPKRARSKRPHSRSRRSDKVKSSKRSRISPRSRSPSRRVSKEKLAPYTCTSTKDSGLEKSGSRSGTREERYRSGDKYLVDRPSFRGPEKEIMLDRDSLKKIVVNMRGTPTENDTIKRDIVNPEEITVVRRAGEGSRPIFDRDEIKNSSRKLDEDKHGTRRLFLDSPPYSGRRPSSIERYRSRDPHYEDERSLRKRDPSGSRPKDYGSHSYERHREERSRYGRRSRSYERCRDFGYERRDRYDDRDYRRSRIRGRSSARPYRRYPSPMDVRRINGRRLRSTERDLEPRHRDKDRPLEGDYPVNPGEPHPFYEEGAEPQMPPSSRPGGHPLAFRGRGGSGMPMVRGEMIMRGGPPVRPVRAVFIPRVPGMGRRLPFHPRMIRPLVRPVIRVIAPVIPVRSPSVIPVRHPVIPLPFQCEAFR